MNDFQKLQLTVSELMTFRQYEKIYFILFVDKYFYWGDELIKVSKNKKHDILQILTNKTFFKNKGQSAFAFFRNFQTKGIVINHEEINKLIKVMLCNSDYKGLYKYLYSLRFFSSINNFDEFGINELQKALLSNKIFEFIFGTISSFKKRKGKPKKLIGAKNYFLNYNIMQSQKYFKKFDISKYKIKPIKGKDYGCIKELVAKNIFRFLIDNFFLKTNNIDNYYFIIHSDNIYFMKKEYYDNSIGSYYEEIKNILGIK